MAEGLGGVGRWEMERLAGAPSRARWVARPRLPLRLPLPLLAFACSLCLLLGLNLGGGGSVLWSLRQELQSTQGSQNISRRSAAGTSEPVEKTAVSPSSSMVAAGGATARYEVLSERPRVLLFPDLLTTEETRYLMELARPHLGTTAAATLP